MTLPARLEFRLCDLIRSEKIGSPIAYRVSISLL